MEKQPRRHFQLVPTKSSVSSRNTSLTTFPFPPSAMSTIFTPPSSMPGSKSSSRTATSPLPTDVPAAKSKADDNAKDQKIEKLEAKLARKDAVMAELLEAHTLLKKDLGEI